MTIVEALKSLVTAIGGSYSADDDTVSEILEKVTSAFESGEFVTDLPAVTAEDNGKLFGVTGGEWGKIDAPVELPAVTADDNGKLLGVDSGEWGKVDAPSNAPYDVPFTVSQSGGSYTATTTSAFEDVFAVADAENKIVRAKANLSGMNVYFPLCIIDDTSGSEKLIFSATAIMSNAVVYIAFSWFVDGTIVIEVTPLTT